MASFRHWLEQQLIDDIHWIANTSHNVSDDLLKHVARLSKDGKATKKEDGIRFFG